MGEKTWIRRLTETQPDRYPPPRFGAMAFGVLDTAGNPVVQWDPSVVDIIRTGLGFGSLADVYIHQPAVRICANFLSRNIAHTRLKTYQYQTDGDIKPTPTSELSELLRFPNEWSTGFDFMRDLVADLAIYTNGFVLKRRAGRQKALFRIPPAFVTPKGGNILTGAKVYQVDLRNGNGPVDVDPGDIVHFRDYNPLDTRTGIPLLKALTNVLLEESEASKHRAGYWKSAARREGVIKRPKGAPKWDKDGRDRFREMFQNRHAGSRNAGVPIILEDDMDWVPDSFSPKDSEFIAGREWALDTVATAYAIPLAMLSRNATPTFASMKEFRKMLYVDTLGPWNASIESRLMLDLVRREFPDSNEYLEFNIEEKLQGDFESQADAIYKAVGAPYMSVNEARQLRGLPKIQDPDFDAPPKSENFQYASEPDAEPEIPELPDNARRLPTAAADVDPELLAGDPRIFDNQIEALERVLMEGSR